MEPEDNIHQDEDDEVDPDEDEMEDNAATNIVVLAGHTSDPKNAVRQLMAFMGGGEAREAKARRGIRYTEEPPTRYSGIDALVVVLGAKDPWDQLKRLRAEHTEVFEKERERPRSYYDRNGQDSLTNCEAVERVRECHGGGDPNWIATSTVRVCDSKGRELQAERVETHRACKYFAEAAEDYEKDLQ